MLTLYSCNNQQERSSNTLSVINVANSISSFDYINLSEIADSIIYVPLETDSNCLIVFAHQIIVTKDRYIIVENQSCKAFDNDGRYICSYGSAGNGPGQFLLIDKVSVDVHNNLLYLSCGNMLIEYTLNGRFVRNISIPQVYNFLEVSKYAICVDSNNYWCVMEVSDQPNKVFSFNDNSRILNYFPNYYNNPKFRKNIYAYNIVSRSNLSLADKIIYKDGLSDTAYYFTANLKHKPAYTFNFGEYSRLKDYLISLDGLKIDDELKDIDNHIRVFDFIELSDLLLFTCSFGNNIPKSEFIDRDMSLYTGGAFSAKVIGNSNNVGAIFNKKTSKLVFLRRPPEYRPERGGFSGFVNDIDGGTPFWPSASSFNNKLVYMIDAYDLKLFAASETFKNATPKYPERKDAFERLADNLSIDSNPVLMVVILK